MLGVYVVPVDPVASVVNGPSVSFTPSGLSTVTVKPVQPHD